MLMCCTYELNVGIKGFFYNIDKDILFDILSKDIKKSNIKEKEAILWLANLIIYHNPTTDFRFKGDIRSLQNLPPHKTLFKLPANKGLPIGNLTSQFFANVYMNRFDHFVKRKLQVKKYIRYVDDFVLFSENKNSCKLYKKEIESYLEINLKLHLRDDSRLRANRYGLDFLGYIIRPHYILVRKRVINNYKQKKAKYLDRYEKLRGSMHKEEIFEFVAIKNSFISHCSHANSRNLIYKVGEIDDEKYINSGFFDTHTAKLVTSRF